MIVSRWLSYETVLTSASSRLQYGPKSDGSDDLHFKIDAGHFKLYNVATNSHIAAQALERQQEARFLTLTVLGEAETVFTRGHALVIGIANYPHMPRLPHTVLKDAQDTAAILQSTDYCGYPSSQVELLIDGQATVDGIREAFSRLAQCTKSEDTVVIFFSGHGGRIESGPDAGTYLIPFDCNPEKLQDTALGSGELTVLYQAIKAERVVILLDACHSAATGDVKSLLPIPEFPEMKAGLCEETYDKLAQGAGRIIMASSRADEVSLVLSGMQNSLFTHYLLDALKGAALTHGDGVVRVFDVFHYVSEKVPSQANQHPIFKAQKVEASFPIALYRGGKAITPVAESKARVQQLTLDGRTKLAIIKRLIDRWIDLATYFEIPHVDHATFEKGHEPRRVIEWLEQRNRQGELRSAFEFLEWNDLIEELDRLPQK